MKSNSHERIEKKKIKAYQFKDRKDIVTSFDIIEKDKVTSQNIKENDKGYQLGRSRM